MPSPSEIWRRNHPWAAIYSFALAHPPLAIAGGATIGTDIRLLYRAAEKIGEIANGSVVLDVPCGAGVALRGLRPDQKLRYIACDISSAMLERTGREAERRGLGQVELLEGDIANLPFDDGEIDVCLSFTGLHCVPRPRDAVLEIARVVKPGGAISGSLLLADAPFYRRHVLIGGRAAGLIGPSATQQEILDWLAEAGFDDIRFERSGDVGYFQAEMPLPPA
ncbi:class I SAM-dependent methyltransferase [soil metagenome]